MSYTHAQVSDAQERFLMLQGARCGRANIDRQAAPQGRSVAGRAPLFSNQVMPVPGISVTTRHLVLPPAGQAE